MRLICFVLLGVILAGIPKLGTAHALDPGYLSLQQSSENVWRVFWRKPDVSGKPMSITPRMPQVCEPLPDIAPEFDGRAWVTQWQLLCTGPLNGESIVIEGLEKTQTDVLIRIEYAAGDVFNQRVTASSPALRVPVLVTGAGVFWQYLAFGYEHILEGWDHLLFVFALLVLIQSPRRLVGAISAFTLAHSFTLAAAVLGFVRMPSAPVEAAIALSIVLLAVEILKQASGTPYLTSKYPWIVAFLFGLLHGFGFAGALSDIGLPAGDIPLALLAFNLGVEAGQLVFISVIAICFAATWRIKPALAEAFKTPGAIGNRSLGYGVGCVSVWWLAERVAGF